MPFAARQYDTLADVLHALGDIPPRRILWNPPPGTATEADQLRVCETKRLVELIGGGVVEKAMGARKSYMAATLIAILYQLRQAEESGHRVGPGPHLADS